MFGSGEIKRKQGWRNWGGQGGRGPPNILRPLWVTRRFSGVRGFMLSCNFDFSKIRRQFYDEAASMAGEKSGVKTQIIEDNEKHSVPIRKSI